MPFFEVPIVLVRVTSATKRVKRLKGRPCYVAATYSRNVTHVKLTSGTKDGSDFFGFIRSKKPDRDGYVQVEPRR